MTSRRTSKRAVVIREGNADDTVKAAVCQLLNGNDLLVDNRNCATMTQKTVQDVVSVAKSFGAPIIIEQGAITPHLKTLDCKGCWIFLERGARRFSFWFIDGAGTPSRERLITV